MRCSHCGSSFVLWDEGESQFVCMLCSRRWGKAAPSEPALEAAPEATPVEDGLLAAAESAHDRRRESHHRWQSRNPEKVREWHRRSYERRRARLLAAREVQNTAARPTES